MADTIKSSQLPMTKARTAPSILIKAAKSGEKPVTIGAVQSFKRAMTRNTTRRFELDSDIPGQTTELIPQGISNFTITVDRVMLNTSTMLKAFGFKGVEDLVFQNIPITIEEHRYRWDDVAKKEYKQIVEYVGCFFTGNPQDLAVNADWTMVQSATLDVATCIVHDEA